MMERRHYRPACMLARTLLLVSLIAFASWGGASMATAPARPVTEPLTSTGTVLPPVILLHDTGINPYHIDYRLPAGVDPAALPGYYPEEATLLDITLDASSYDDAIAEDSALWSSLELGRLYAFNGTRIVGGIQFMEPICPYYCPYPILDVHGHGSVVASAAAGAAAGSCAECRIVMAVAARPGKLVDWALEHTWMDTFSLSSSNVLGVGWAFSMTEAESKRWTTAGRTWFGAAGNGHIGGAANHLDEHTAPPWVVRVGRGDPPRLDWTQTFDIVAQTNKPVAIPGSLDEYRNGGGTSTAAPDAAGHYLRLLWDVRVAFADHGGATDGALARTNEPHRMPTTGPLADGVLTATELEDALITTARDLPAPGPFPPELSYFWQGRGMVDENSLMNARAVLAGSASPTSDPWAEWWHSLDQHVRGAWGGTVAPCKWANTAMVACLRSSTWDPLDHPDAPPL